MPRHGAFGRKGHKWPADQQRRQPFRGGEAALCRGIHAPEMPIMEAAAMGREISPNGATPDDQ
jgi:hypothetical protein